MTPVEAALTPRELLALARAVLAKPETIRGRSWPRTTALLARQSLEAAVDAFWAGRAPGMDDTSRSTKLRCLPFYVDDPDQARLAYYTWGLLSDACHHHAYELAPTAGELTRWIDAVDEVLDTLD